MTTNASETQWYCCIGESELGPLRSGELKALAREGKLLRTHLVWKAGSEKRVRAEKVLGLFDPEESEQTSPAAAMASHDVFISYSTQDKTTADAICATLERERVRCWIAPRDVLPSVSYGEAIIDGINASRLMVVVFSTSSNASPQVLREVERGVKKGIPIVPFRIEDIKPSKSMEYFLSVPHWLDALSKPLEAHIERLAMVVRSLLATDSVPRAADDPAIVSTVDKASFSQKAYPYVQAAYRYAQQGYRAACKFAVLAYQQWRALPSKTRQISILTASILLGIMYFAYLLTPNSLKADYAEYRRAVTTGNGSVVFLNRVAPSRYSYWRTQAEAGDAIAQLFIARCYEEGFVVKEDSADAIQWLEKAAAQENDFAMLTLGLAYESGHGVKADISKALDWYTRSAETGNCVAMRNIGHLYDSGVNTKANPELALKWFRKAASAGDPLGMRAIGEAYKYGTGVKKDAAEADKWFLKAANAGDAYMMGKLLGNKLAAQFKAYLAADANEAKRSAALLAARKLKGEYERLEFEGVVALFEASELSSSSTGLTDLKPSDPLRLLHDELTQKFVNLYTAASKSERKRRILGFASATEPLIQRWYSEKQYEEIVEFWEKSYADVPLSALTQRAEFDSLVRQLNNTTRSQLKVGKRNEAKEAIVSVLDMCDRALKDRPWDWYLKNAYMGFCFETAATWAELGESSETQPLLQRAWTVALKQYGKEELLKRHAEMPLKGKVPASADDADRDFFKRFGPDAKAEDSGIKRFTVTCEYEGATFPFHVYVLTGPRGYLELQDQFRWLREYRGMDVPKEERDKFHRLHLIASENSVNFMDLCVYALGTGEDKSKDPDEKTK